MVEIHEAENGRTQLETIVSKIRKKFEEIAKMLGGRYIDPLGDRLEQVYITILEKTQDIRFEVDEVGKIKNWTTPSIVVEYFNKSGCSGFIIFPEHGDRESREVRMYRGAVFFPQQAQIASLARVEGISVQDILDFAEEKVSLEELVEKGKGSEYYDTLKRDLVRISKYVGEHNVSEMEAIARDHIEFASRAVAIDLWVSAVDNPLSCYRHSVSNKRWGEYLLYDKELGWGIQCILVMDIPEEFSRKFPGVEYGILGEIQPEWIKAIVPAVKEDEVDLENVRRAEELLGDGD